MSKFNKSMYSCVKLAHQVLLTTLSARVHVMKKKLKKFYICVGSTFYSNWFVSSAVFFLRHFFFGHWLVSHCRQKGELVLETGAYLWLWIELSMWFSIRFKAFLVEESKNGQRGRQFLWLMVNLIKSTNGSLIESFFCSNEALAWVSSQRCMYPAIVLQAW